MCLLNKVREFIGFTDEHEYLEDVNLEVINANRIEISNSFVNKPMKIDVILNKIIQIINFPNDCLDRINLEIVNVPLVLLNKFIGVEKLVVPHPIGTKRDLNDFVFWLFPNITLSLTNILKHTLFYYVAKKYVPKYLDISKLLFGASIVWNSLRIVETLSYIASSHITGKTYPDLFENKQYIFRTMSWIKFYAVEIFCLHYIFNSELIKYVDKAHIHFMNIIKNINLKLIGN